MISVQMIDKVMSRDLFKCIYCDFQARDLNTWMQLTIDHIFPRHQRLNDDEENLATCCSSCNSITSRMKFDLNEKREIIIKKKKETVKGHLKSVADRWIK